ncbi:hypothetical protein [Niallia sp. 01092]|uniref:hypothetical protein n=1 Tax=unclassified Niallia TaxID=2837522 RepID=UPI003FD2C228
MKDATIDYDKIIHALNQSLEIIQADNTVNKGQKALIEAQQTVQQAMSFTLSRDSGY